MIEVTERVQTQMYHVSKFILVENTKVCGLMAKVVNLIKTARHPTPPLVPTWELQPTVKAVSADRMPLENDKVEQMGKDAEKRGKTDVPREVYAQSALPGTNSSGKCDEHQLEVAPLVALVPQVGLDGVVPEAPVSGNMKQREKTANKRRKSQARESTLQDHHDVKYNAKPKKPIRSGCALHYREVRCAVKVKHGGSSQENMKCVAEMWNALPWEEKEIYNKKAEQEGITYKVQLDAWKIKQRHAKNSRWAEELKMTPDKQRGALKERTTLEVIEVDDDDADSDEEREKVDAANALAHADAAAGALFCFANNAWAAKPPRHKAKATANSKRQRGEEEYDIQPREVKRLCH